MTILTGKTALVTGASRGIGKAIALALGRAGVNVGIVARATDNRRFKLPGTVDDTVRLVEATGGRALAIPADLTSLSEVDRVAQEALEGLGQVDILVNNAAFRRGEDRVTPDKLSEEVFRRVLDIKLVGSFLFSKAVAGQLIEQGDGGRIINVSSVGGKRGSAITGAYATANFGLQGFTQVLAQWLGPYGISCNAVCPGVTDTSRMDDVGYPRDERWKKLEMTIPLRRAASDDEIADVISFLCSSKGAYVNGQSINVCGGMVMW